MFFTDESNESGTVFVRSNGLGMPAGLLYQSTFREVTLRYINFLPGLNVVELHVSPRDLISRSNFLKTLSIPFLAPKPGI